MLNLLDRSFDFGDAIKLLKKGYTLTRDNWHIEPSEPLSTLPYVTLYHPRPPHVSVCTGELECFSDLNSEFDFEPSLFFMKIDKCNNKAKWSPSAEDMLAEDWRLTDYLLN